MEEITITSDIFEQILSLLGEITEIHDVDEYGFHSPDCIACRAREIIDELEDMD